MVALSKARERALKKAKKNVDVKAVKATSCIKLQAKSPSDRSQITRLSFCQAIGRWAPVVVLSRRRPVEYQLLHTCSPRTFVLAA